MKKLFTVFTALLFAGIMVNAQTIWSLDEAHSNIKFSANHMVIAEVEGHFNDFEGTVTARGEEFNGSEIMFSADVNSIDTGNDKRDGHLKSEEFFYAEKYPKLSFNGKLNQVGNDFKLVGDLTIRDVTKKVAFDVNYLGTVDTGKGKKAGFKITGDINRFEFNLNWDNKIQNGSLVVGETIRIICNVELNQVES